MKTTQLKYLVFLLLGLPISISQAQPRFNYPASNAAITSTMSYRSWSIKQGDTEKKISQLVFPLTIIRPLGENLDLLFSTSNASTILETDTKYQLDGLTDGKLKLFCRLANNTILLNLGVSLPYGKNAFSYKEYRVANSLYETILGFRNKRFGEGFDIDLGAICAKNFGRYITFGAGIGYLLKGEYEFLNNNDNIFKPGDEFSVHAGIDLTIDSVLIRTDILYATFGQDKFDGKAFLKAGNQIELESILLYQNYPFVFSLSLRDVIKQHNDIVGQWGINLLNGRNFIDNSFLSQSQFIYNISPQFALSGKFGYDKFGKSDIQLSDAWIIHAGAEFYLKFSETIIMRSEVLYLTGEAEASTIILNGWHTALGFSFRF